MSNNKQTKKKIRKKRKTRPIVSLLLLVIFGIGVFGFLYTFQTIYTVFDLKNQISSSQTQLDEVQSENDYLTAQKEKLSDPDYVISYARSNYMLSKQGDTIFYLPSDENKQD